MNNIFQIPDFRFEISDSRYHISDFRFQVSDFGFQIPVFRFQISDFQIAAFRIQMLGEPSFRGWGNLLAGAGGTRPGNPQSLPFRTLYKNPLEIPKA